MSNSDSEISEQKYDFGSVLSVARISNKYTIEEVSEYLKIPEHVINAIESNNIDALPPPTFTQGYIRAYAKYLDISEDEILEIYNRAVPHNLAAELKSRSKLKNEANSQSPVVKSVSLLLIIAGITAVIYGSYQYYLEKAEVMESEFESKQPGFTGNSLNSPGIKRLNIQQKASLTDDDEPVLDSAANVVKTDDAEIVDGVVTEDTVSAEEISSQAVEQVEDERNQPPPEDDIVEIYAEQGAWLEVYNARQERLFYNMLPVGASRTLIGLAPFKIALGNAKSTRVIVNNVEIDKSTYIRRNNTASFTVSIEDQKAIFH